MHITIKGLEEPFIVPGSDGKPEPFAIIEFPKESGIEDILVPFLTKFGTMQDDLGRIKSIVSALDKAGFDIIGTESVKFSSLTPEEHSVLDQNVKVERKTENG